MASGGSLTWGRILAVAFAAMCFLCGAAEARPAKVLIVTASEGKRKPLARLAERRLVAAARREGLRPVRVRKPSRLKARRIRRAAAVVFAAGRGTVLRPKAEKALNRRVRRGGGVVLAGSSVRLQPRSRDFVTLSARGPDAPTSASARRCSSSTACIRPACA